MAVVSSIIVGSAMVLSAGASIYSANKAGEAADDANALAKDNMATQAAIAARQLRFQKEQQKKLDAQKELYKDFEFSNPYKNIENIYDDMTVNQQEAEFVASQDAQQRSEILSGLRSAAGSSGISGLAQSMANQGALQAQRAGLSIGKQEQSIGMAQAKARGAADMAFRGGEAQLQQQEMSRNATLLGIEMGGMAGANAGVQSAYSNQMAAGSAAVGAMSQQSASLYGMAGAGMQAFGSMASGAAQGYGSYMQGGGVK